MTTESSYKISVGYAPNQIQLLIPVKPFARSFSLRSRRYFRVYHVRLSFALSVSLPLKGRVVDVHVTRLYVPPSTF